jgi:hypothetical protein
MIIKNFVGRISGIVSYSDQSTGQFAVTVDEKGNFATNSPEDNKANAYLLLTQRSSWWLNIMTPLLEPHAQPAFGIPPILPDKTVTGFAGSISGTIVYDDNSTTESFSSSWNTDIETLMISEKAVNIVDRILLGMLTYQKFETKLTKIWENGAIIMRDNSPPL